MSLWKNCDNTGEMVNNPLSTANYSFVVAGIPCECRRISGCHLSTPKIMLLLRTQFFWKFLTRNFDLMILLSEFSVERCQQFPVFLETRQNPLSPSKDPSSLNVVGVEGNKEVRTSCYPFPALPLPISLFPDPWLCPSCSLPL